MNIFSRGLLDLFFPPRCLSCHDLLLSDGDDGFCPECRSRIAFLSPPFCRICGMPLPADSGDSSLCLRCSFSPPPYEICRSVGRYESVLLETIHALKYRQEIRAGAVLGNLLSSCLGSCLPLSDYDRIIPVPLHKKRLRKRGFNQSLLLARALARDFSLPLDFQSLQRRIHTDPQIGLGRKEREANVRNVFEVARKDDIADSRILLVDDVYTTGSTVRECTRILLESGAQAVGVVTLARA